MSYNSTRRTYYMSQWNLYLSLKFIDMENLNSIVARSSLKTFSMLFEDVIVP